MHRLLLSIATLLAIALPSHSYGRQINTVPLKKANNSSAIVTPQQQTIFQAQVIPDDSLPDNSVVNEGEITGGTTVGDNLFHSFIEFSLNSGTEVFFNQDSAIANIISRVTGNSVSQIDGLIRANGTADLFLINPNGIIFGEDAALNIGGSFISSTADSIQFADGESFSAVNPDASPLLTVSIPVGLQYGNNPQDITLEGAGNNLSIDPDTFTVNRSDRPLGLEVGSGNTLALLGGNILLPGGNLTAADGKVVLGSLGANESVRFSPDNLGWRFDYSQVDNFNNIGLSEAASIEVSGNGGGEALLTGREINLADGSAILADTLGDAAGIRLVLSATERISLTGFATNNSFPTRISTDVDLDGSGTGGNLTLNTSYLLINNGAQVNSGTFGLGDAGNLQVNATEIEVLGESDDGEFVSGLFAQADFGETGDGGNLAISTDSLLVARGANISTTTFGTGNAGNLDIQANTVELTGFSDIFLSGSGLSVTTEGEGDGGNLNLATDSLLITEGADISTTTFGTGNGGNVAIQANKIELVGEIEDKASGLFANVEADSLGDGGNININSNSLTVAEGAQILAITNSTGNAGTLNINSRQIDLVGTSASGNPSGILANANVNGGQGGDITLVAENVKIAETAQIGTSTLGSGTGGNIKIAASNSVRIVGNSDVGSSGIFATALLNDGAGGNITLETSSLSLEDGATISASNFPSSNNSSIAPGKGAAGSINIISQNIALQNKGTIIADTFSGDRGNINLQTDLLLLRGRSTISTNAQETATGGNINIDASNGFIVALPQENSDITANAVFGDGGRVNINALEIFGIEPRLSLTPLSDITASSQFGITGNVLLDNQDLNPTENTPQLPQAFNPSPLARGCNVASDNSSSFVDLGQGGLNPQADRALNAEDILSDVGLPQQWREDRQSDRVVEAQSWVINKRGNIVLQAQDISPTNLACRRSPD